MQIAVQQWKNKMPCQCTLTAVIVSHLNHSQLEQLQWTNIFGNIPAYPQAQSTNIPGVNTIFLKSS